MKPAAALALTALLPSIALAQSTTNSTVTFSLTWQELNGNNNGDLSPGESALIKLTASFTNQNTVASFSPPIGTYTSGAIRGLASGFLDLIGTATNGANANGSWNLANAVLPAWDLIGPSGWGIPAVGGSRLNQIQFGQFPFSPAQINTTNPIIDVWQAAWTPNSYAGYYADFTLAAGTGSGGLSAALSVVLGAFPGAVYAPANYGSVRISVGIPAPGALPLLAGAWLAAPRRRRR